MSTRSLRRWTWIHTWTSLVSMVFMLMLCLTGLPLVFHDEIEELFEQGVIAPDLPPGTVATATLDRVVEAARQARPNDHPLFVFWREENPSVTVVAMSAKPIPEPGQSHNVSIDSRTAALLGDEPPHFGVMDSILKVHKDMFAGLPGELFLGFMGLLLVLSIVSGVVVYAPFMRRLDFGTIRRTSKKLAWLDLHNLAGMVTVVWLLVVGFTGALNTLSTPMFDLWRMQELPKLLGPFQGMSVAATPSLDAALAAVRARLPDAKITSVTMPTAARFGSPRHLVVWIKGDTPITSRLFTPTLVTADATLDVTVPPMPWYLRTIQVSRPLHFGDYGGLPLKILWALLDLLAIAVLVSGIYLWFARKKFFAGQRAAASPSQLDPGLHENAT
jgi:uncharacterized iron-regulated membrane protein